MSFEKTRKMYEKAHSKDPPITKTPLSANGKPSNVKYGNGYIESAELEKAIRAMDPKISGAKCTEMMQFADTDGDGRSCSRSTRRS